MENRLNGKVALVTGSSRGIGRAIAEQLADLGAKVVINYSGSAHKADEAVKGIKEKGGEAVSIQKPISARFSKLKISSKKRSKRSGKSIF